MSRTFLKLYDAFFNENYLTKLTGNELKMILYIGSKIKYNKTEIYLDDDFFIEIENYFGISKQYIKRILKSLKEKNVIYFSKYYLYVPIKYFSRNRY